MDAKLFTKMVMELLSENGQVVLNDFGTFSTEIVPAYFSDKGFTLNPPYLKVRFSLGKDSDDALARLYAESNGIGLPQSRSLVLDYIGHIRREIAAAGTFVLPGLGRLRAMSKDNVFFIPQEGLSLFPAYDLLEPVSLKSLSAEIPADPAPEPIPEPIPAPTPEPVPEPAGEAVSSEESRSGFPFVKILVAVVIAAAVFFAVLAVLGRFFPDTVDPLLYSAEELDIIRYKF